MDFITEIWSKFRPYLIILIVDALISYSLWLVLFSFKKLTEYYPVTGWSGDLINNIHAASTVLAYLVFATMLIVHLYDAHRTKTTEGA